MRKIKIFSNLKLLLISNKLFSYFEILSKNPLDFPLQTPPNLHCPATPIRIQWSSSTQLENLLRAFSFVTQLQKHSEHQQSNYIIESINPFRYRPIKHRKRVTRRENQHWTQRDESAKVSEPLALNVIDVLPLRISSSLSAHDQRCASEKICRTSCCEKVKVRCCVNSPPIDVDSIELGLAWLPAEFCAIFSRISPPEPYQTRK